MSVETVCSWARVSKRYHAILRDQQFWYKRARACGYALGSVFVEQRIALGTPPEGWSTSADWEGVPSGDRCRYSFYNRRIAPAAWFAKCDWRDRCIHARLGGTRANTISQADGDDDRKTLTDVGAGVVYVCGGIGNPPAPQAVHPETLNDVQAVRCRTIFESPSEMGFYLAIKGAASTAVAACRSLFGERHDPWC